MTKRWVFRQYQKTGTKGTEVTVTHSSTKQARCTVTVDRHK